MNRTRFVFITIIAIAVIGVIVIINGKSPAPPQGNTPSQSNTNGVQAIKMPSNGILVSIASSSTKQEWMEQAAKSFNAEGKKIPSGEKIVVQVSAVSSGGSTDAILDGKLKPVAWSPGVESWVSQLNEKWKQNTNKSIMSSPCKSSIYTPLGFAMWRPMAEALGWPNKPIGWQTLVDLAADSNGWARYGHAEWGKFRLGHAHPKYSNSGLLTMTSFVYGMTGKSDNLTAQAVYAPKVEMALRALAQNTAKYGVVTEDLLELMVKQGPRYLHAAATYESDTIRLNRERGDELRFPLAFIFPSEGVFWGNHPYCILDKADWVTAQQAEGARLFLDYLLTEKQQSLAVDSLLRPLDSKIPLRAPLDLANGTNPAIKPENVRPLAFPNSDVSKAIIDLFMITKRKATVLVVLDISGSMEGKKIRTATEATANFLRRLHPDDKVGVFTFNGDVTQLSQPQTVSEVGESLATRVSNLIAQGSTALHQAVCDSTQVIDHLRKSDSAAGENRLYGIVLLSDGANTISKPTENQMFTTCLPSQAELDGVKIFPIAFGDEANKSLLKHIADVTGGQSFTANPESIEKIYQRISAEQ